ncbi:hypothetical protein BGZ73_006321 [Actinomortierella ambigua]|nr:hypothetical protein BGZ73_006321 [Actinomortierella ambigua]
MESQHEANVSNVVAGARSIKKGLQKAWAQCARKKQELTEHGNSCVGAVSQDPSDVGLSILRNINLHVKPGQVCVLLGSSGAGKTTLLNALAGRMEWGQVAMTGQITFNGEKAKKYWKSPKLGYLYQDDHLEPYLTPRETLEFVSKLHEGTIRTTPEMTQKIERLLTILGLKDCADRRVGVTGGAQSASVGGAGGSQVSSRQQKGISGGEKRRVSVAVQLLKDPSILFCDEPTSGLDSFASYEVMKALVSLAKTESKTVICSIHQPRSEIFELLAKNDGQLVLLSLGSVVYSGPIASAMDWFESQEGLPPCPKDLNQFDFMIDWSSIDFSSEQQEHASHERRQRLVSAWAEFSKMTTMTNFDTQTVSSKEHISLPVTEEQSSSSYPLLYMIVLLYRLSKEIRVFDRERKDGCFGKW